MVAITVGVFVKVRVAVLVDVTVGVFVNVRVAVLVDVAVNVMLFGVIVNVGVGDTVVIPRFTPFPGLSTESFPHATIVPSDCNANELYDPASIAITSVRVSGGLIVPPIANPHATTVPSDFKARL